MISESEVPAFMLGFSVTRILSSPRISWSKDSRHLSHSRYAFAVSSPSTLAVVPLREIWNIAEILSQFNALDKPNSEVLVVSCNGFCDSNSFRREIFTVANLACEQTASQALWPVL